jgi:GTP-binding protein Era
MSERCGFVAVIGAPNAGKSTLVNALVGTKVSIVSPKVQTTRSRVLGIALRGDSQIVFLDTPGIFKPSKRLERAMVSAAWDGVKDADMTALVIDAAKAGKNGERIPEALTGRIGQSGGKAVLVLNKIDLIEKETLLSIAAGLNARADFEATFMVSALKEKGLAPLRAYFADNMPEGVWHFDADIATDMPSRMLAAEITREHIFRQLHEELPYGMAVMTENWEEFDNGSIKVNQIILVSRQGHKGMVLGKGGARIRAIGEAARKELSGMFETEIHLKLFVKVQENWRDDPAWYAAAGLDFNA